MGQQGPGVPGQGRTGPTVNILNTTVIGPFHLKRLYLVFQGGNGSTPGAAPGSKKNRSIFFFTLQLEGPIRHEYTYDVT